MKLLLDTHVFLWWIADDERLSAPARAAIADSANEIFVSAASGWEIAIKAGLGRLSLPDRPARFVPNQVARNGFTVLSISLAHALAVEALPALHRDPFDRLLVAQSRLEKLPVITDDAAILRYDVRAVW